VDSSIKTDVQPASGEEVEKSAKDSGAKVEARPAAMEEVKKS